MYKRVCVVLVTYNRSNCLATAIKAIEAQSVKPAGVLVFDNNSSDDTIEYLKQQGYSEIKRGEEEQIDRSYYHSSENLGGSGGFSLAVELASQADFDYLWIMDDDVAPTKNCLEILLNQMQQNKVQVTIPARKGPNFTDKVCIDLDTTNFLKFFIWWRKKYAKRPLNRDTYTVKDMTFEGPLISNELVKRVGKPDGGYFIQFDDTDYAERLLRFSKIIYVRNAVLLRQLPAKIINHNEKKTPMNWKDYYFIRNNVVFDKRYGKKWMVRKISPLLMVLYYVALSVKDGNVRTNFPIIIKAARDGMAGKMGKQVDPNY